MTQDEKNKIISNDYTDLFIEYNRNEKLLNRFQDATTHIMNNRYAVAYVPASMLTTNFISQYGYAPIPHLYGLTSLISLEQSGVQRLRRLPGFQLRGSGVIIAVIDTGIDYTNPIFIREDGSSKIIAIWDQTIDSTDQYPSKMFYGTEYKTDQINLALKSTNPLAVVPSTDDIGHGTALAGVIAGSASEKNEFYGVVPDADLIVVKLKQAKQNLKDFFYIPSGVPCYQENDIMWAFHYIMDLSLSLRRPCAVCIGLGTSQGSHDGRGPLDNLISFFADVHGFCVSLPAGNEGRMRRHYYHTVDRSTGIDTVELNIGNESGFTMELWGNGPNTYSIDILSPSGEYVERIAESLLTNKDIQFIFESTKISINYQLVEAHSGEQLILLRFQSPTPGLWKFKVYSRGDTVGSFHIWLPITGFISENTYFISSTPDTTITSPGNTPIPITVTAYNPKNGSLFVNASKGFTRTNDIKPDLAAPGVDIIVPNLQKGFSAASGTSIAAAHVAGISAMMLEWGIMRGFYPSMNTTVIKKYLIRGASRDPALKFPNRDWGYGKINIYNVFDVLRTDFPTR